MERKLRVVPDLSEESNVVIPFKNRRNFDLQQKQKTYEDFRAARLRDLTWRYSADDLAEALEMLKGAEEHSITGEFETVQDELDISS